MTIIETERLFLQKLREDDASFIFELLNTPTWIKNIGDRNIRTLQDAENYIQNSFRKSYQENGFGLYKMVVKSSNKSIGICGLVNRPTLPNVDIGFALLPDFERQGYAYEAAQATMDFAKTELSLKTILGITHSENLASRRLLEKIGLQHTETNRDGNTKNKFLIYST